ncbi:NACHT, LRR and PYD domains-containing protein 12-like [Hemitrygon akajei]|uniref:NACHT, LRR and PYD domains-containing protein 12-like n=1 Tax=Hemitrygon akajei TaxID=2704970 RepID=UPI003BF9C529
MEAVGHGETTCRVIDWVKQEVKPQSGNTGSEVDKTRILNALHYLFESQNRGLAQETLGSLEKLSFSGVTLTPIDCAVLSHVIGLCDTIKHLDLWNCHIECEGIQRLEPRLHNCQELRLGFNELGDEGVKLVSAALRNPESKIKSLWLGDVGLTDSVTEDLVSALITDRSLTELDLSDQKLGDSGVKLVSAALRNPECKIQKLGFWCRGSRLHSQDKPITDVAGPGIKLAYRPICPRSPPPQTDPPESGVDAAGGESVQ